MQHRFHDADGRPQCVTDAKAADYDEEAALLRQIDAATAAAEAVAQRRNRLRRGRGSGGFVGGESVAVGGGQYAAELVSVGRGARSRCGGRGGGAELCSGPCPHSRRGITPAENPAQDAERNTRDTTRKPGSLGAKRTKTTEVTQTQR